MRYIITTVGTSAIEKSRISVEDFKGKDFDYFNNLPHDLERKINELNEYFNSYDINTQLNQFSAEIKSLVKLGCNNDTFNYLITSDTAECRICSEFLKNYIFKKFQSQSEIVKISKLQIENSSEFQKEGIKNLGKVILDDIFKKFPNINDLQSQILINITGGYKATIPYLSLLAMLYNLPIYYIFEDQEDLIRIPPLPVKYDIDIIKNNINYFIEIERNTYIPRGNVNINENNSILFEEENNRITISYWGILFWERYKDTHEPVLVKTDLSLDRKVINLGNIAHHGRNNLERIAQNLIQSPYVIEVINSSNNMPQRRNQRVIPLRSSETQQYLQRPVEGVCIVIDYNSDAGYSMLVQTTGRIFWETKKIAEELKNLY